MTEDDNKTCGFVIDVNIQRSIDIIMNYASKINPKKSSREALKYILEQRLIEFNVDEWNDNVFGVNNIDINNFISKIYNIYTSQSCNSINKILENIDFKINLFSKDHQLLINQLFNINKSNIKNKINNILNNSDIDINKGIDKKPFNNIDIIKEENDNDDDIIDIDKFNDIIKKLIPLLCLITISNNDCTSFNDMCNFIKENEELKPIILDTIITWFGKKVEEDIFNIIIMLYDTYFKNDDSFNNKVADIKDIFKYNLGNQKELSNSIDKFLIPHELEKKQNAEISTPHELRKEMINKIPEDFWKTPKKVFEPCCGKGGFLLDIIDKFMEGLKDFIEDKEERYKLIIEECLYYSDINPTNIYISRLLLNPYNKYKLNNNQGDTLKLNIKEKWDLDGFDLIIGNPPYENINATGDNKLYLEFTKYSINILKDNRYLLFITPINIKNYLLCQNKNRLYIEKFYKINYLAINTPNKYFKNIGNFFIYFLLEKIEVNNCNVNVEFLRKSNIEYDNIILNKDFNIPLCLSNKDILLINKISNLLINNHKTFDIKKAIYDDNKLQRIRKEHINKNIISKIETNKHKYKIIDKITKNNIFPGVYYYNDKQMIDYGKMKIIMCSGGYLSPSLDIDGNYNLSDNMIYMLCDNINEFNGLKILINSKIIKYLNNISMTDGLHGRDIVIKSIKYIDLNNIKNEDDLYNIYNIYDDEKYIINNTI